VAREREEEQVMIVGLDIETTGLDIFKHGIVQLGIAKRDAVFAMDVHVGDDIEREAEAMIVNGFDDERIAAASCATRVEAYALEFLGAETGITAVGWNVGSFDLAFIKRVMPALAAKFSHRSIDLNSQCDVARYVTGRTVADIKESAKKYAEAKLDVLYGGTKWHDAGYDAAASLHAYDYIQLAATSPTLDKILNASEKWSAQGKLS
jgi:oligoribonuclease (3'-5' exoribonuclease)